MPHDSALSLTMKRQFILILPSLLLSIQILTKWQSCSSVSAIQLMSFMYLHTLHILSACGLHQLKWSRYECSTSSNEEAKDFGRFVDPFVFIAHIFSACLKHTHCNSDPQTEGRDYTLWLSDGPVIPPGVSSELYGLFSEVWIIAHLFLLPL